MNAIAKTSAPQTLAITDDEAIRVLQNSLYPGARPESIRLVLAWCRATGRDPMKKPIHIVPMYVRDAVTGKGEMRDVLMPGIGTYRSDAASSGQYAGKDEPEFGPDTTREFDGMRVTFPLWCRVTVRRFVHGDARLFTAKELWVENYATGKEKKGVNDMWRKRPYGQLAKVAEAQALRMAFPDETGSTNTQEEMEGKIFDGVTLDASPEPATQAETLAASSKRRTAREWLDNLALNLAAAQTQADVDAIATSDDVVKVSALWAPENNNGDAEKNRRNAANLDDLKALMAEAQARVKEDPHDPETDEGEDKSPWRYRP
jgi:phage recombination protein Bet